MELNDIDLNKLPVFMEVARQGGITKAAVRLRLTPSAVSQSIRALEEALGVSLFDRAGKSFPLSQQGTLLYQSLGRYQEGLLESLSRIGGAKDVVKGQIRLGVFYGFSNEMIAGFLAALRREHPELDVDVVFGAPSELDRLLASKRLDFAVNLFQAPRDLALRETPLMEDELWLVSAQRPPRRALGFTELRKAPFVDYYRRSRLVSAWIAHHFGKRVREIQVVMYAAHSELVVQLIMKGVGIGIVASSIAKPYVDAGALFVIRGKSRQLVSPIWLKEHRARAPGEAKKRFKEALLTHFTGLGAP